MPLRLIIKFKSPKIAPASPEVLSRLSAVAGVQLVHVRPMFGGMHVISTERPVAPSMRTDILNKLADMDDVEYVEEDALMQPLQGQ